MKQVVVYKATRTAKHKRPQKTVKLELASVRKRTAKLGGRIMKSADYYSKQYLLAVRNPFADEALGCVVPDTFPWPTTTYHYKADWVLNASAGGIFGGILLPSPTLSTVTQFGNINGPLAISNGTTTVLSAAVTDISVSTQYSTARTVACGFRFRNVQPFNTISGRIIFAPFICNRSVASQSSIIALASTTALANVFNNQYVQSVSPVGPVSSQILELPGAFEVAADQLIGKDIVLSSRPVDPSGIMFRSTSTALDVSNGTGFTVGDNDRNAGGAITSGDQFELSNCDGTIGWAYYGLGFPTGSNVMEIEAVYHMEGQPVLGTGNLIPSGASHMAQPSMGVDQLLMKLMDSPMARLAEPLVAAGLRGLHKGMMARIAG
jgi:hypothetical protein